jgi:hypothetical protein
MIALELISRDLSEEPVLQPGETNTFGKIHGENLDQLAVVHNH